MELNGSLLERASDELKKDRNIVLVAVQHDGCGLEFASGELKNDFSVVLAAVRHYWNF